MVRRVRLSWLGGLGFHDEVAYVIMVRRMRLSQLTVGHVKKHLTLSKSWSSVFQNLKTRFLLFLT